ncbi:MAG: LamG-like jellyroll fold domain-containing protein, partial [Patescibacteria group bacterium]|nr:LamG-like jellyroll fold domain-containing protein [Patescibacteria group bacterium]
GTGAGGVRVYVNGRLAGTGDSFDYSGLSNESMLRLGAVRHGDGYRYLKGDLDDVGIWRVALAEAQVLSLYEFALEPELGYDLGQVQQLFGLYQLGPDGGGLMLDDVHRWRYTDGLDFELGTLNKVGDHYFVQFDAAGAGLTTIPEPGTVALLIWALTGLLVSRRRRLHRP